jgi:hypothetical protein
MAKGFPKNLPKSCGFVGHAGRQPARLPAGIRLQVEMKSSMISKEKKKMNSPLREEMGGVNFVI